MKNQQHENYKRFSGAFFNTANEKHLNFNLTQQLGVRCALCTMVHYYQDTDEFHQIRNGEQLACNLSRKQGGGNHHG